MIDYQKEIIQLFCNDMAKREIMGNPYLAPGQKHAIRQVMDVRHRVHMAEIIYKMWRGM